MARGRKPQPTKLRILRGNPGRRTINRDEPTPGALEPTAPAELRDRAARAEWTRLAPELFPSGHVTIVDRGALIGYCLKYAQWLKAERAAARKPLILTTAKGYPIPNPALGLANKLFALVLKASAELGITPSSRSRVAANSVAPGTPASRWSGLLP